MEDTKHFIKVLESCHTNKLALIYKWVRSGVIEFDQFEYLLEWLKNYNEAQIRYDTFD